MGFIPISLPYPTALFDKLDEFMLEFEEQDQLVEAGVISEGEASAYALVWEWGNARQTQKGPKTVMGVNPDGQRVWLSIQAPYGWIRINEQQYWDFLMAAMDKAKFGGSSTGAISDELRKVARTAARQILALMKQTVPVDSGALQDSLKVVDPEDYATLDLAGTESDRRTLVLGGTGEEEWIQAA